MPILNVIATLLIIGVILWGLDRLPWIDASIKQVIRVVIVVVVIIWLIQLLIGGVMPWRIR